MKHLLFDLDGTLIDDNHALQQGFKAVYFHYFNILGGMNYEQLFLQWQELTEKYFTMYINGDISLQEHRRARVSELFQCVNARFSEYELDGIFSIYLDAYESNWCCFDDVIPVLHLLQNYSLAILSNGRFVQQLKKLEKTGLSKYFSLLMTPSEIGYVKPAAGAFITASAKMNAAPDECIYIGDNFQIDILGSFNVGMKPVWVRRTSIETGEIHKGIKVIASLSELPALISE
jgi:putative hydrolase of the HAD superfamily